jgi:hypothetical protein
MAEFLTDQSINQDIYNLSVVIATLGGRSLSGTIEQLNSGSVVPSEILICIPKQESSCVENLAYSNVKIIHTVCRGQVYQRAVGFQLARGKFVLQLDDDLLVDTLCVEKLVNTLLSNSEKVAVAPSLVLATTGLSCYHEPGNRTLFRIYFWIVNGIRGYVPGTITKAGTCIGVDPALSDKEIIEVEWVPGGCVMHYRSNLIFENYYPFGGKAYCEDLFHSYFLSQKGIKLFINTTALCYLLDDSTSPNSASGYWDVMCADLKVRKFFVRLSGKSIVRMYFHYLVLLLWNLRDRLKQFYLKLSSLWGVY